MKARLSKAEVQECIERFLDGTGGRWDWDDFTSIPIHDPALEAVRIRCASLPLRFPSGDPRRYCSEEGLSELGSLAQELRARPD